MSQDKYTKLARGEACQVRIPGVCNGNWETTVLAHYRLSGLCGIGMKPPSLIGAWACSSCHDVIDGRVMVRDVDHAWNRLAHAEGCLRTLNELIKRGLLPGGKTRCQL